MAYSPSSNNNFMNAIPQFNQPISGNLQGQSQGIGSDSLDKWAEQLKASQQAQQQTSEVQSSLGGGMVGGGLSDYYAPKPAPASHDCPHCGRCPNCGRGGYGYVPYYPPPIPYYMTAQNGQAICGNENRIY